MDYLSRIKSPIELEIRTFNERFAEALAHKDGLLAQALHYITRREGKRMRPMLVMLMAKNHGPVSEQTINTAVALELLHTASLVHDDVVDESNARRGQASVNAVYDNKVAVLVGDYLLASALLSVAKTDNNSIVQQVAMLGRTLAAGEMLQLTDISSDEISEDVYYKVIQHKTASLFEACCVCGVLSTLGDTTDEALLGEEIEAARLFGRNIGMIFQIRDDIFDYYPSADIGKPTGNDMAEGRLTLPAIYAVNKQPRTRESSPMESAAEDNASPWAVAQKIKSRSATAADIAWMVDYAKEQGGIDYAVQRMLFFHGEAQQYLAAHVASPAVRDALQAYLDFMIERNS